MDDEAECARLLERQLGGRFDCVTVGDARAALAALEHDGPFAVVVSDYDMPGIKGTELLREVKTRFPQTAGILLTAVAELDLAVSALNEGAVFRFVRKPWTADEIQVAVQDAAAYAELVANERRLRDQLAIANAELDEKVQDLDEANQLLEYWVEFSPAILYSFSWDGAELRASYIGKNFLRLSGHERTTAVIDPGFWSGLMPAADRARYQALVGELLEGERLHGVVEYTIRHRDGNPVRVLDSMRAVHDGDGHTLEIVGAWLDISARD
ncbi:MAG: response regulator [Gammaproteobacteria bacterium]